jgi:hypothetical protein
VSDEEPQPQSSEDAVESGALDDSRDDGRKSVSTEQSVEAGELDDD